MKENSRFILICFITASFILLGVPLGYAGQLERKDLIQTLNMNDSLHTFTKALESAETIEVFKGDWIFTIFAPMDSAFLKIPEETRTMLFKPENKDQLESMLSYHVVPEKILLSDLAKLKSVMSVNGDEISIELKDGVVIVDKAHIIKGDIICANGVIHIIDTVILHPN